MTSETINTKQTAVQLTDSDRAAVHNLITKGDLARLSDEQKTVVYLRVCESVGLNPMTKPFDYITLNGRMVLYCTKGATDQIRNIHKVSIEITGRELKDDIYVVTARGKLPDGRVDESTGAVCIRGLTGDAKANAFMKSETKAKRRVTLSLFGLGFLDESEVESIPSVQRVPNGVDHTPIESHPSAQDGPKTIVSTVSKGQSVSTAKKASMAQIGRLKAILKRREPDGWDQGVADQYCAARWGLSSFEQVDWRQYKDLCDEPKDGGPKGVVFTMTGPEALASVAAVPEFDEFDHSYPSGEQDITK